MPGLHPMNDIRHNFSAQGVNGIYHDANEAKLPKYGHSRGSSTFSAAFQRLSTKILQFRASSLNRIMETYLQQRNVGLSFNPVLSQESIKNFSENRYSPSPEANHAASGQFFDVGAWVSSIQNMVSARINGADQEYAAALQQMYKALGNGNCPDEKSSQHAVDAFLRQYGSGDKQYKDLSPAEKLAVLNEREEMNSLGRSNALSLLG